MASALTPMPSFSLGSQAPCLGVGCQACLSPHLLYLSPSVLQGSGGTGIGTDTEGFSSLMVNSSHRGCDLSSSNCSGQTGAPKAPSFKQTDRKPSESDLKSDRRPNDPTEPSPHQTYAVHFPIPQ